MADLENGLWAGAARNNPANTPLTSEYVTAMVKGGSNGFALKGGDATQGALKTMWDGARPNGYQPMKKQGSIILCVGGEFARVRPPQCHADRAPPHQTHHKRLLHPYPTIAVALAATTRCAFPPPRRSLP